MRKVLFLSTSSNETLKYGESLECLGGFEVAWLRYDEPGVTDEGLYRVAKEQRPEFIVYIGSRWGPQPSIYALTQLNNAVAPSIHLCSDAADPPWWDLLNEYHNAGAFALQVAIDGNPAWPLATKPRNLTALTPINPAYFGAPPLHENRAWACGYAGNAGSEGGMRRAILTDLAFNNALRMRLRGNAPDGYQECCDFIKQCRMTLNVSFSGTETVHQVKGRVVEAGLAGSCLLEIFNGPAAHWFTPGVDYLTYSSAEEARALIAEHGQHPELTQQYGERLRNKILSEHSPVAFWSRVLKHAGIAAP